MKIGLFTVAEGMSLPHQALTEGFSTGCTDPDTHRRALKSTPLFVSFNF